MTAPIPLDIPLEAFQLMLDRSPKQVYQDMLKKRGISRLELLTFAVINTPIIGNQTGETVGYVSVLSQGVSVCSGVGDWLDLIGTEDAAAFLGLWENGLWQDEAVRLFTKYHAAAKVNP